MIQNQFRYLISFSMALICSVLTFTYDFFRNSHWGIYHIHAYINYIYISDGSSHMADIFYHVWEFNIFEN